MKGKQNYIDWSGFHWVMYFPVNGSLSKRTPHRHGGITLDKPVLRKVVYA